MTTPGGFAPMTYLDLCQRTAIEAGIANASQSNLPIGITGQVGELARVVKYVADAWREIQGNKHWDWMWEQPTISIAAGASSVAAGNVSQERWDKCSVYIPTVNSDSAGRYLEYLPWDVFRTQYPRILTGSSIGVWSIAPDRTFRINGVAPTGGFVCTAERYASPTNLSMATDVPGMPADFHMLIVYKAMRKLAGFDEAGSQRQVALDEERALWNDLTIRCLPSMRLGGSILDQL